MFHCVRLSCRHERPRRRSVPRRDGVTAVEFALVAPVVLLFFFSGVVFYGVLMTQNTLTAAAREGARIASLREVTSQSRVIAAVEDRLQRGGADPDSVTISVSPSDLTSVTTGDKVSISVSMPLSKSTWVLFGMDPTGAHLAAEITYVRE